MAKLTQIIRNNDPVTETDANKVFELLIPIVETVPQDEAAVETAASVISRCALDGDRHLAHVLDWWYVVTTGRPSANGGAHRLPDSLDGRVKPSMEAVVGLNLALPAAEWLKKRRHYQLKIDRLDEMLRLESHGGVKHAAEHKVWSRLSERFEPSVNRLKTGRRADRVDIDASEFGQLARDEGIEVGSRAYKRFCEKCERARDAVNETVDLQAMIEPWIPRPRFDPLTEVPKEFKHAVGPLAEALLRPILATNVAPDIDRHDIAEGINTTCRSASKRGRYKLAKVVDAWCEETGQSVESLADEIQRHRDVVDALRNLDDKADSQESIDEIKLLILDDDIDEAEKTLKRLQENLERRAQIDLSKSQLQGLRRRLEDSRLAGDPNWVERVDEIERRFDTTDPSENARVIGIAQSDLSNQLDRLVQEQEKELNQLLVPLEYLGAPESTIREWKRRIKDVVDRKGRGASELEQDIARALQQLRAERRGEAEAGLEEIRRILTVERGDFSGEDYENLANRQSEIEGLLDDQGLSDVGLRDALGRVDELQDAISDRRIFRWQFEQGEDKLVEHVVEYCKGPLDFDSTDIRRLYVSLKTRPFVILAGITGSGKSSLTRAFAESFGATGANGRFRRVAVRPDWIDQTEVLGFVNPISERFVPGWLAETVRDCERDSERLHFVLLDEMNLAPVEQYLAEWLSAIEETRSGSENVQLPLYSASLNPKNADDWRPLSERVLDRANVLQLNVEVSERHHKWNGSTPAPWHVGLEEWSKVCTTEASNAHHDFLIDVADILRQARIGVGLRAHLELERFVANAEGILEAEEALDWGIVQRIIPKIRGFKITLNEVLRELLVEFEAVGAHQSASIINRWLDERVSDDEFLEGTDPRLSFARI